MRFYSTDLDETTSPMPMTQFQQCWLNGKDPSITTKLALYIIWVKPHKTELGWTTLSLYLSCTFILPFESSPQVWLLLRITAVQTGLVAVTICEFVHGGPARNARVSCLRRWDERTHEITCVNKSLLQTLENCPSSEVTPCTCCSANISTFSRENSKSAGFNSKCIPGQLKIGCNTLRAK